MGRLYPNQTNFTAGELSEQLLGRVDVSKYYNGAKALENMIIRPHGGASKTPGSHYVSNTLGDNYARLVRFEFSTEQAYILEFTDQAIRFYKDNGLIVDPPSVTNGTFDTDIAGWHDHSAGGGGVGISWNGTDQRMTIDGGGAGPGNYGATDQQLTVVDGVEYALQFDSFDGDVVARVYTGDNFTGTLLAEQTFTPGVANQLDFTANGTTAYIGFYNEDGTIDVDNISVLNGAYQISTPYLEAELDDLQFAQSADVMWICHPNHQPRKLTRTGHTAWTLTLYNPTAGSFTSTDNYPAAVTFFQQRIVFGGTNNDPSKIWASVSGDYEDMSPGTGADDDAYVYVITSGSGRVPVIQWLAGADDLLIGCAGMVARATGGNYQPITPGNIDVREQTTKGAKNRQPIIMDNNAIYIQRSGRKIRDMGYQLDRDGYLASDVILLSEHVSRGGIDHMAYQDEPYAIMWAVRADGTLLGMTYEKAQDVVGWHRHIAAGTDAEFESVATIPIASGDQLWAVIKRTIDGSTVRHVVYFDSELWREALQDQPTEDEIKAVMPDCFYVDSGLTYDGGTTSTITGLSHLVGEEVAVLADGARHPNVTVQANGSISLQYDASKVHVGLPYTSKIVTLPIGDGGGYGSPAGRKMRWNKVHARLYLSHAGSVNGDALEYMDTDDVLGQPSELVTGVLTVNDTGWNDHGEVTIEQDAPLPFTVLSVGGDLELAE